MHQFGKLVAVASASLSLIATSTAAVATGVPSRAASPNAWLALTALTPASLYVLDTTGVAVVQPDMIPPATQICADGTAISTTADCGPPPGAYMRPTASPIPVFVIWAAMLGTIIYLASKDGHSQSHANSPA